MPRASPFFLSPPFLSNGNRKFHAGENPTSAPRAEASRHVSRPGLARICWKGGRDVGEAELGCPAKQRVEVSDARPRCGLRLSERLSHRRYPSSTPSQPRWYSRPRGEPARSWKDRSDPWIWRSIDQPRTASPKPSSYTGVAEGSAGQPERTSSAEVARWDAVALTPPAPKAFMSTNGARQSPMSARAGWESAIAAAIRGRRAARFNGGPWCIR